MENGRKFARRPKTGTTRKINNDGLIFNSSQYPKTVSGRFVPISQNTLSFGILGRPGSGTLKNSPETSTKKPMQKAAENIAMNTPEKTEANGAENPKQPNLESAQPSSPPAPPPEAAGETNAEPVKTPPSILPAVAGSAPPAAPARDKPEKFDLDPVIGKIEELSEPEQTELYACEEVIATGWNTYVQVGLALAQIRNKRLYRTQYFTFEEYCRTKWSYGRHYVCRLISAAQVFTHLLTWGYLLGYYNHKIGRAHV